MNRTTAGRSALATVDLVVAQGATNRWAFRYLTGDPAAPVDLTGWTARAQIRTSVSAADAWLTASTTSGTIHLDADGGVVIEIPYALTTGDAWDARDRGVWDLELTSPSAERIRLVEGDVRVSHDVTREP